MAAEKRLVRCSYDKKMLPLADARTAVGWPGEYFHSAECVLAFDDEYTASHTQEDWDDPDVQYEAYRAMPRDSFKPFIGGGR